MPLRSKFCCSGASEPPRDEVAEPPAAVVLLEAWVVVLVVLVVLPVTSVSDSDGIFVHCRAFFYSKNKTRHRFVNAGKSVFVTKKKTFVNTLRVNRLILPGSLKKMLFFTRSPRT